MSLDCGRKYFTNSPASEGSRLRAYEDMDMGTYLALLNCKNHTSNRENLLVSPVHSCRSAIWTEPWIFNKAVECFPLKLFRGRVEEVLSQSVINTLVISLTCFELAT